MIIEITDKNTKNCITYNKKTIELLLKDKKFKDNCIILDMNNVNHISSESISSLISFYKLCNTNKIDFSIIKAKDEICRVLKNMNLLKYLNVIY